MFEKEVHYIQQAQNRVETGFCEHDHET